MSKRYRVCLLAMFAAAMVAFALGPSARMAWAAEGASDSAEARASGSKDSKEADREKGKDSGKETAAEPEITLSDRGVTVHAVNAYACRLFTRLADKMALQLVVDDTIKDRKVTVHLSDKTPREIIDCIVAAYGFSSREVNGIVMISEGIPRKPSSYLLSDIESIPTQYVEANIAKSLLPVFLQDHVKVNFEQNAVVLSAPSDVLKKFREDIRQFDIPASQIMLEIMVVEFTDFDSDQFDLGLRSQNAGRGAEFGTLSLPQDNPNLAERSMGEVMIRGVADLPTEFLAKLEALVTARRARVRAAPRIATVSGRWANFFVGIQRYLREPIEMPPEPQAQGGGEGGEGQWGGGPVMRNFIDAGVRLNIAPWTGDGKEIICEVRPEVSTLSAPDPVTGLPEKSTRTASTMVRVRDGQTIIIGGLRQEEQRRVTTKVPLLGDLPLLGQLFRSRRDETTRTDLVIFITPRVLSQTGHLSPEEEKRLHERFLEERPR
jgi:type II secretory pathway component GspD/PulD (secretin)